jgi:hypothetical protein
MADAAAAAATWASVMSCISRTSDRVYRTPRQGRRGRQGNHCGWQRTVCREPDIHIPNWVMNCLVLGWLYPGGRGIISADQSFKHTKFQQQMS